MPLLMNPEYLDKFPVQQCWPTVLQFFKPAVLQLVTSVAPQLYRCTLMLLTSFLLWFSTVYSSTVSLINHRALVQDFHGTYFAV